MGEAASASFYLRAWEFLREVLDWFPLLLLLEAKDWRKSMMLLMGPVPLVAALLVIAIGPLLTACYAFNYPWWICRYV